MVDCCQLSPGAAAALTELPHAPQEIRLTLQIKEVLCTWHRYALSDGINWVAAIFTYDFLSKWSEYLKPPHLITITKACFVKSIGVVFVDDGIVQQDSCPPHLIGFPRELKIEIDPARHFPIARLHYSWELSCFSPIRALVTFKSKLHDDLDIGDPPFFMIHLLDETGEIRAQASAGTARELYDRFEEGKVYYIHNASIAHNTNYPFYNLTHNFKLNLGRWTVIKECLETIDVPTLKFDFMPLAQAPEAHAHTVCDMIGVVLHVELPHHVHGRKTGQKVAKRNITFTDQSGIHIRAILWANRAEEFDVPKGTIVAFRRSKVFYGEVPSLSVYSTSTIHVEPQIKEADVIRDWYNKSTTRCLVHCHSLNE